MLIHILSLFPEYFQGPFDVSMIKRGMDAKLLDIHHVDIRDFAKDARRTVDDRPFGGGPGMVLMPGPTCDAIRSVKKKTSRVIHLSPQGSLLNAQKCEELAKEEHLILLSGHYEGIDERIIESEVDEEISIGDYVLTSGNPAVLVLLDAVARFIPGFLGHPDAAYQDSFTEGHHFAGPHYTRPPEFEGKKVPDILLQGHHAKIEAWRQEQGLLKTRRVRPDLLKVNEGEIP